MKNAGIILYINERIFELIFELFFFLAKIDYQSNKLI